MDSGPSLLDRRCENAAHVHAGLRRTALPAAGSVLGWELTPSGGLGYPAGLLQRQSARVRGEPVDVASPHHVVGADMHHRCAPPRRLANANLTVAAHQRPATDLDLHG